MKIAFIGSVIFSRRVLEVLLSQKTAGIETVAVFAIPPEHSDRISDYADLGPVAAEAVSEAEAPAAAEVPAEAESEPPAAKSVEQPTEIPEAIAKAPEEIEEPESKPVVQTTPARSLAGLAVVGVVLFVALVLLTAFGLILWTRRRAKDGRG